MRVYEVKVAYGQYTKYYVLAEDVGAAARRALSRDTALTAMLRIDVSEFRRVASVVEFCDGDQVISTAAPYDVLAAAEKNATE